jgi:hypothetical protein
MKLCRLVGVSQLFEGFHCVYTEYEGGMFLQSFLDKYQTIHLQRVDFQRTTQQCVQRDRNHLYDQGSGLLFIPFSYGIQGLVMLVQRRSRIHIYYFGL